MMNYIKIFIILLISLMIAGCGSKGDLYLPKKEPEQTKIPVNR